MKKAPASSRVAPTTGLPATAPVEDLEQPPTKPGKFRTRFARNPATTPTSEVATTPAAAPATEPAAEPAGAADRVPERSGWWGSRASLLLLSGLLAVLLLLAGLVALGALGTDGVADVNEAEAVERAMDTAPSAAEAAAAAVLAYDHTSLEADLDNAVKFMTDDFAEEYSETFEKVVAPTAEDSQAKVSAVVRAAGVIRATEDTARVLLFVDQATVTAENQRPRIALNRVVMTMVREGDRWLVDDISPY